MTTPRNPVSYVCGQEADAGKATITDALRQLEPLLETTEMTTLERICRAAKISKYLYELRIHLDTIKSLAKGKEEA